MTLTLKADYLVEKFQLNPVFAMRVATEIPDISDASVLAYLADKPKPFVKWVGGKRQLLKQFQEFNLYPPKAFNAIKNTYYEPFVGGGAVFFDLLPKKAVLSDLNLELVTTYNTIKNEVETLIAKLNEGYFIYDKERFLEIRALPKTKTLSDLETAARFIYLNKTAFNGMYRVNSKGEYNVPFGRYNNPMICDAINLRKVSASLQKVTIAHRDYGVVLDTAQKGDFIYFDPPYYPVSKTASFTSYTNDVFLEKEQEALRDAFVELHNRGCYVMLSNSDTPFIESLFESFKKEGITVHKVQAGRAINSNASKRGKVSEILVTNYSNEIKNIP